ncbi:hypothetical protein F3Y22_tig00111164pilonHSYRG00016 [Hibiscus syriacus]|uniref:Uncharacterized protein n=1 Tax=Hibiscus syriacus TaxID=106335 RepID=A0A6A2YX16_HIBSY|nr:hypothetical protein F3Y22_tig00111164pilonHSYRG00016 [Hibiscus syriacus]
MQPDKRGYSRVITKKKKEEAFGKRKKKQRKEKKETKRKIIHPIQTKTRKKQREGNPYLDRRNHRKSKGVVGVSVFREVDPKSRVFCLDFGVGDFRFGLRAKRGVFWRLLSLGRREFRRGLRRWRPEPSSPAREVERFLNYISSFLFLKEENEGDERFSPCMGLLIPHLKRSRFAPNII